MTVEASISIRCASAVADDDLKNEFQNKLFHFHIDDIMMIKRVENLPRNDVSIVNLFKQVE
jgi:hypothetical protein